ncbi:MAG: hypothetical protein CMJ58_28075 [Planctomycetaceae bacterium]|nr:hypothetical protein [Planctomycetaceae bacterium]
MTLVTSELLSILQCPATGGPLAEADAELIQRINAAIAGGQLATIGGNKLEKPLQGGLVAADRLYPIVDGIPIMLPDEAINVAELP